MSFDCESGQLGKIYYAGIMPQTKVDNILYDIKLKSGLKLFVDYCGNSLDIEEKYQCDSLLQIANVKELYNKDCKSKKNC
tara:strand:- start:360 stop:599 length:240 start_codon:yes stop_codon:yes gene_type:complete